MTVIEYAGQGSYYRKALLPEGVIHWSEAKEHIEERVAVYGEVASTFFDWYAYDIECERWAGCEGVEIKVPPTFIEIGVKYPSKELLKVVIWGRDRKNFPQSPDSLYRDKTVIVKGRPYMYGELVHMMVSDFSDMTIVEPIEGLYQDGNRPDMDSRAVFENPPADASRIGRVSDEESYWEEYAPREPEYYDGFSGNDLWEVGDYFYDHDGNCVDGGADVRERYHD